MNTDWFELNDNGLVRLKPEAKTIPELQPLIKDKHNDKYWQYIWHLSNHKSPYVVYNDKERQERVQQDFLKSNPSPELTAAVNRYKDSLETTSMKLLSSAKKAAQGIQQFLETQSNNGIDINNIEIVQKSLEKIGKIIESLDKLEEKVKKEITNEEKIRGGGTASSRER